MVESKHSWKAWLYLSPAIVLLLIFTVWPIINTVRMSLLEGYSSMSAPTKEFYKILMEGRMIHGGHPVLRWMAGNVVIDTDPAGNIKVTKARSKEKIDGIVAAIMALDRCIRNQVQPQGSVYDERGLLVF